MGQGILPGGCVVDTPWYEYISWDIFFYDFLIVFIISFLIFFFFRFRKFLILIIKKFFSVNNL